MLLFTLYFPLILLAYPPPSYACENSLTSWGVAPLFDCFLYFELFRPPLAVELLVVRACLWTFAVTA